MSKISTIDKQIDKRQRLKELRKFHEEKLKELTGGKAEFIPKMAYQPYGKNERHLAFFPSELNRGEDIYVELCSKDLDPEDPQRRLWKWKFNPHYQEEYDVTEPHATSGHIRYLIPVGELEEVAIYDTTETVSEADVKAVEQGFELDDPDSGDIPMAQLTARDYAAIHLRIPESRRKWLNELIEKSIKNE